MITLLMMLLLAIGGVMLCQLLLWIDPLQDIGEHGEQLLANRREAVMRGEIPAEFGDYDGIDNWEVVAVDWLKQGRELSAIELLQHKLSVDSEQAKVKLLKLDESAAD